jgi:hypothetical protein
MAVNTIGRFVIEVQHDGVSSTPTDAELLALANAIKVAVDDAAAVDSARTVVGGTLTFSRVYFNPGVDNPSRVGGKAAIVAN